MGTPRATKKKKPRQKKQYPHFAIGLPVRVRKGAVPVGWQEGEKFVPTHWDKEDYLRSFQIQSVSEHPSERTSYEVMGWFWKPEDLEIPYT